MSPRLTTVVAAQAGCAFFAQPPRARRRRRSTRHAAALAAGGRVDLRERAAVGGGTRPSAADLVRDDRSGCPGGSSRLDGAHHAVKPPSTRSSWPVTYDDAGEARKTSGPFRSSASAMRPQRHARAVLRLELLVLARQHAARRQRVHAHAGAGPVRREELRQVDDAGLRRAVGRRLDERRVAGEVIVEVRVGRHRRVERADVDDRPAAALPPSARRTPASPGTCRAGSPRPSGGTRRSAASSQRGAGRRDCRAAGRCRRC